MMQAPTPSQAAGSDASHGAPKPDAVIHRYIFKLHEREDMLYKTQIPKGNESSRLLHRLSEPHLLYQRSPTHGINSAHPCFEHRPLKHTINHTVSRHSVPLTSIAYMVKYFPPLGGHGLSLPH